MKKTLLVLSALSLIFTTKINAQIINPGFETWTTDMLVPSSMNPNSGNDTYGWWDFNYFNSSLVGSSPISVTQCTDTVRTGNYSVRLETKVYTPTSWNIYKNWGIPYIGHQYNDTLGILFDGKVNVTNQTFRPGIACSQSLSQFKFYYQYQPMGNDTAECRVSLLNTGSLVAGGKFKTNVATGSSGWQQAVINFTYVSVATPDTLLILFSSSSFDHNPKAGSVLWIDDVSVMSTTNVEEDLGDENTTMLFPNPSKGVFLVNNPKDKQQTIEVFNILGEKIYSKINPFKGACDVDISNMPKGAYFVILFDGEKSYRKKIIIQ